VGFFYVTAFYVITYILRSNEETGVNLLTKFNSTS